LATAINQEIVLARLCSAFAPLALVIACVGLYGTTAYAVARRTREIGIRVALGARRATVMWMVLREVCVLTVLGLVVSVPIALASSRVVPSFVFDTRPNDPANADRCRDDSPVHGAPGRLRTGPESVTNQPDARSSPGLSATIRRGSGPLSTPDGEAEAHLLERATSVSPCQEQCRSHHGR
jgi:ABC-type antimicrobial peptide transport system permease subunit